MTSIPVKSEAHWHELRSKHVGASEVAAVVGVSSWETQWSLHMRKRGKLADVDMSENVAVQAGHFMEPALSAWAASKWGMTLRKVHRYIECDDCPAMGASLDYEEYGGGELVPVEFKWSMWGQEWEWDGDTLTDFPLNYGLQVQAQMACAGASSAWLVAFCGGDLRRVLVPAKPEVIAAMKVAVAAFWQDVLDEREPPIDFTKDAKAVRGMMLTVEDKIINLDDDARVAELCAEVVAARAAENEAKSRKDAASAELLIKVGTAKAAKCGRYKISAGLVAPTTGTLVTPEMVGTTVGARSGYRRLAVTKLKAGKSNG